MLTWDPHIIGEVSFTVEETYVTGIGFSISSTHTHTRCRCSLTFSELNRDTVKYNNACF